LIQHGGSFFQKIGKRLIASDVMAELQISDHQHSAARPLPEAFLIWPALLVVADSET
jgi:hypothetical protein